MQASVSARLKSWVPNWNNNLALSGSGMEALGVSDIREAAGAIAAFLAAQDIYKSAPSVSRDVAAVLDLQSWWVHQLTGNVATVTLGASSRQFVRLADNSWIAPGPGYATMVQTGARTATNYICPQPVHSQDPHYAMSRGWDESGLSFSGTSFASIARGPLSGEAQVDAFCDAICSAIWLLRRSKVYWLWLLYQPTLRSGGGWYRPKRVARRGIARHRVCRSPILNSAGQLLFLFKASALACLRFPAKCLFLLLTKGGLLVRVCARCRSSRTIGSRIDIWTIRCREDAHATFLACGDMGCESFGGIGRHFEARFAFVDADSADIALRDLALAAYLGQQPFRIGVAFAADSVILNHTPLSMSPARGGRGVSDRSLCTRFSAPNFS